MNKRIIFLAILMCASLASAFIQLVPLPEENDTGRAQEPEPEERAQQEEPEGQIPPNQTPPDTVKLPPKENKTYVYDSQGQQIGFTESITSPESPDKKNTYTHIFTYDSLGRIENEIIFDHETGESSDPDALRQALENMGDEQIIRLFGSLAAKPDLTPSPDSIFCPPFNQYETDWPEEPYDFGLGDCDSPGKETAIEGYIAELKAIAQGCLDGMDDAIEDWYALRDALVEDVNKVCDYKNIKERDYTDGGSVLKNALPSALPMFQTKCGEYSPDLDSALSSGGPAYAYTNKLKELREASNETCQRALAFEDDLLCFCDELAAYINPLHGISAENQENIIGKLEEYPFNEEKEKNWAQIAFDYFELVEGAYNAYYDPEGIEDCDDFQTLDPDFQAWLDRGVTFEGFQFVKGFGDSLDAIGTAFPFSDALKYLLSSLL